MADTHVLRVKTDEAPGPMYMCIPFNGMDQSLYRYFTRVGGSMPKHWHWEITKIYTVEEIEETARAFVELRKANGLDV